MLDVDKCYGDHIMRLTSGKLSTKLRSNGGEAIDGIG